MPTDPPTPILRTSGRWPSARLTTLLVSALATLLALFPPETRGESWIGCALLIGLLATLQCARPLPAGSRRVLIAACLVLFALRFASPAPGAGTEPAVLFLLAGVLGISVAALPRSVRAGPQFPWVLAVTGAVVAGYGLVQTIWGLEADAAVLQRAADLVPDQREILVRLGRGRAFAAFPTPAALGAYLALTLPTTAALGWSRAGTSRWVLALLALLQLAGMFATVSVTALAALAVAIVTGLVAQRGSWKLALSAGAALVLALAVLVAVRADSVLDVGHERNPLRLRAGNFRIALEMIRDQPWLGVGPGGYGEAFPAYRRSADNEARHVHDFPLEAIAELGIPLGLLASVGFALLFFAPVLRQRDRGPPWQTGLAVGLAAFAVHNLVDFTAFLPSLLWTAALARGLLRGSRSSMPAVVRAAPGLAILSLAIALAATAWGMRIGAAANDGYRARESALAGELERALQQATRASRRAPWDVDWPLFAAQAALDLGEIEAARGWAERAVRLEPRRPSARAVRARVRLASGDTPGAYADLEQAARLYPTQPDYAAARDELRSRLPGGAALEPGP